MPRGTTLANLRSMLKAEIGDNSGTNSDRDSELNSLLSNMQYQLLLEKEWAFMTRRWDVVVTPGQQFVTYPTKDADYGENGTMNLDEIDKVEVYWNTQYYPVLHGIGSDEYNFLNPALGQNSDPIRRWRESSNVDETTGANQFEIWPVPTTQQTIRFTAERLPFTLVQDTDKADLDDLLLVYAVAAQILQRNKQADAQAKAQLFARRLHQLGARNPTREKKRTMGGGVPGAGMTDRRTDIKLVAIH